MHETDGVELAKVILRLLLAMIFVHCKVQLQVLADKFTFLANMASELSLTKVASKAMLLRLAGQGMFEVC